MSRRSSILIILVSLAGLVMLSDCGPEQREVYARLEVTHDAFASRFPGEEVSVNFRNHSYLWIMFTNSPLNNSGAGAQEARAFDSATLAVKTLGAGTVQGNVQFLRRRDFFGLSITTPVATYPFTCEAGGRVVLSQRQRPN